MADNSTNNKLINALKEIGVDVEGTISRFMNNSEIYVKFLSRFPDEDRITPLRAALDEKDCEKIISAAHKLKGVSANLGMTELSGKAAVIVKKAREGIYEGLDEDFEEAKRLSDYICEVIKANI